MESIFNSSQRKIVMDQIDLIDGYNEKRVRGTLNLFPRDRKNEFSEMAKATCILRRPMIEMQ
jgi:hypothetical protein